MIILAEESRLRGRDWLAECESPQLSAVSGFEYMGLAKRSGYQMT